MSHVSILAGIAAVQFLAAASPGPTFLIVSRYAVGGSRRRGLPGPAIGVCAMKRIAWLVPVFLCACAAPAQDDLVRDGATAISLVQKVCNFPAEDVFHRPNPYHADFSDGSWHVWMGLPECHFGSADVNAHDGQVSGCTVIVCTG